MGHLAIRRYGYDIIHGLMDLPVLWAQISRRRTPGHRPPQEDIAFTGHSTAACRSSEAEASETRVELLQLPHRRAAAELVDKWPPALLVRPEKHKHVL